MGSSFILESNCGLPKNETLEEGSSNYNAEDYFDVRGARWNDVWIAIAAEQYLLQRLHSGERGDDLGIAYFRIYCCMAEFLKGAFSGRLIMNAFNQLDHGVVAATLALSALGCAPYYSCNGGLLDKYDLSDEQHREDGALIDFFAPSNSAGVLSDAAGACDVSIVAWKSTAPASDQLPLYTMRLCASAVEALTQYAETLARHFQPQGVS